MAEFIVTWVIDVEAETPLGAALMARDYQQPGTEALVFSVEDHEGHETVIDLLPDD